MSVNSALVEAARILKDAKNPDTEDNFRKACKEIGQVITPELIAPHRKAWKPRVAFYLPSTAVLAHTANLQTLLTGLREIDNPLETEIWASGTNNVEFAQAFHGLATIWCNGHKDPETHWKAFQDHGHSRHLDAVIHVSNISGMAWAAGIRCAKKHLWWLQKWDGDVAGIDGVIDGRDPSLSPLEERDFAVWTGWGAMRTISVYTALPELHRPDLAEHAKTWRQKYAQKTIYGVFARDEKFSPEFVACCQRIMAETPEAHMIYASRKPVPGMPGEHVGWLPSNDLAIAIQGVDVILDTWPFSGGHVTFQAMASRKPIVFMRVPESGQHFAAELMTRAGLSPYMAHDPDGYVSEAINRARNGFDAALEAQACHDFYAKHLRDTKRMASEFTEAVRRLI